jgi:hypothetical protein
MSKLSELNAIVENQFAVKKQTGKFPSLEDVIAKFGDGQVFNLIDRNGERYEYNGRDATKADRLKQLLSSIRSANKPGRKGADPKWYRNAVWLTENLSLGRGESVDAIDIEALESEVE